MKCSFKCCTFHRWLRQVKPRISPNEPQPPPEGDTAVSGGFSSDPDHSVQTLISATICSSSTGEDAPPPLLIRGGNPNHPAEPERGGEGVEFNPSLIATQPFNCWEKSLNEPFNLRVVSNQSEVRHEASDAVPQRTARSCPQCFCPSWSEFSFQQVRNCVHPIPLS